MLEWGSMHIAHLNELTKQAFDLQMLKVQKLHSINKHHEENTFAIFLQH